VGVLVFHGLVLTAAFGLAGALIEGFTRPFVPAGEAGAGMAVVIGLQLALLTWRRQCLGLLSYFGLPELRQMGIALGLATALLALLRPAGAGVPPLNFVVVDALLAVALLGGSRLLLHRWRERTAETGEEPPASPRRVGIIGAGNTGTRLALELTGTRRFGRTVVAFFDDDARKWRRHIHDIPVVGMPEFLLDGWISRLDEVVIAMPGAREGRIEEIVRLLGKAGLKYYTVPCPVRFWADPGSPRPSVQSPE
jgi:FlaA1/EpsC-like NDP-sugar epimerase